MLPAFSEIKFLGSFPSYEKCPVKGAPEFAFIGRSNVGKSSLINMLTGIKNLAKTSSTPGKTLMLNLFGSGDNFILVDLPGYGYAKVSKSERARIQRLIRSYFQMTPALQCVFLLIDLRIPRQESDKQFMEWLAENGIPFVIVFTKADKLSKIQEKKNSAYYLEEMKEEWEELPQFFITSSQRRSGREELITFMETILHS